MSETPVAPEQQDPLAELNKEVPVGGLLTPEAAQDALKMTGMAAVSIFRNSPMGHSESEMLLGKIAVSAVVEGKWVDVPKQGHFEQLVEKGFVTVVKEKDGSEGLRPTETLAEFVQERFKPWAPKAPTA